MSLRRSIPLAILTLVLATAGFAETFTSGLLNPSRLILTARGNILVSENGNGPNTGRISLVNRLTGERTTVVDGLPAAINSAEDSPSGPTALTLRGNTLYVVIGQGDAVEAGPVPGSEKYNPAPSSPLLSSVLQIDFTLPVDEASGFTLATSDQPTIAAGDSVTMNGAFSQKATIRKVVDFPNVVSDPLPNYSSNVEPSNPYGIASLGSYLYVNDASHDLVYRIDPVARTYSTLVTFPDTKNTAPIGGPFIESVPDSIRADGDRLLLTFLTGFPFLQGTARVIEIDPATGNYSTVVGGLTTAIDVTPLRDAAMAASYATLEFSTDMLNGAPGRATLHSGDSVTTLAAPLITPTSMIVDARTGDLFVSQMALGNIVHFNVAASIPAAPAAAVIPVVASLTGAFGSQYRTSLQLSNPFDYAISGLVVVHSAAGSSNVSYSLASGQTRTYADIMQSAGATGLATIDLQPAVGPAPVAIARIGDTSRPDALGTVISSLTSSSVLSEGQRGWLLGTAQPDGARENVGVRALGAGATVKLTLQRSNGAIASAVTLDVLPNTVVQQGVAALFGVAAQADDSIAVEVTSGSAIVYASTVSNTTQDASWQIATPIE